LTYTKHLADLLQLIGEAGNAHLKSIIDFIVAKKLAKNSFFKYFYLVILQIGDNDDIKRTLLVQLPYVIEHLRAESYGYGLIRDIITPALFSLIGNENLDVNNQVFEDVLY